MADFDPIVEGAIPRNKTSSGFDPIAEGAVLRSKNNSDNQKVDPRMFGQSMTGESPQERNIALNIMSMLVPSARIAKFLPEASGFLSKALTNYGGSIAQNAGIQAGLNAAQGESPETGAETGAGVTAVAHPLIAAMTSGNPITRLLSAGALGGGAAYGIGKLTGHENTPTDIGAGLLTGAMALRGKTPNEAAMMQLLKGIKPEDAAVRNQAAQNLGLKYLTPAEATGIPYVGEAQGKVGQTFEGSKQLFEKSQDRLQSERDAITGLMKSIGDKDKLAPQIQEKYRSSYNTSVSPEFVQNLKNSDIINEAFGRVKSDSAYSDKLKDIPEENFQYLDQVKRALNDMSNKAIRAGENDKARLIKGKTDELTSAMENLNPDYKDARELAQRSIVNSQMQKVLNQKPVSGSQFFNKFLANTNNYNDLLGKLKNVPDAQNQLRDMKLAFEHLINPVSARAGAKLASTSMINPRNAPDAIAKLGQKILGGKYDTAAVNLITDPKWADQLSKIKDLNSNNAKTQMLANLLSRAGSEGVTQQTQ